MTRPIIAILNGPNLNLLGERQPLIYGTDTLDDHVAASRVAVDEAGFDIEHVQSNHEGALIDAVHSARGRCAAIVINAGALTHGAWGLADALSCFEGPVVEVHISNPYARERWRHTSVITPVADVGIVGAGGHSYVLGVAAAVHEVGR